MKDQERMKEITSKITAFSKQTYTKKEFLPELLKLQKNLVDLTFIDDSVYEGEKKLWDVENYFKEQKIERGVISEDELARFINDSEKICNTIKAEISGNMGEQKVFDALSTLGCPNGVLHNIELEFDGRRTEIDAIVFTNHAVFIIEIKNSRKNIYIDENGTMYRIGNSMHCDGNIADKMRERESLLRIALERAGIYEPKVFNIVVFTNPQIDVENKYHRLKVCGVNYLPFFIEKFRSKQWYPYEMICTMMAAVNDVKCPEAYQMPIDMQEYKSNFAKLIVDLEADSESNLKSKTESLPPRTQTITTRKQKIITKKHSETAIIAIGSLVSFGIGVLLAKRVNI